MALGFFIIAYYPTTEWMDAKRRQNVIENMEEIVYETDTSKIDSLRKQAYSWNAWLAKTSGEIPFEDLLPYNQQLALDTADVSFASVIIPKLSLSMPIYHGTDDSVLSAGCGHLEYTSLPIGGNSTHAAITAHSGMKNMRAFDDIQDLKVGDVFGIRVLGETICYEVTGSQTVLPDEVETVKIKPNEDLCTLVTCTPYGINTHRLLVTGKRCPVPEGFGQPEITAVDVITNRRVWPTFLAALVLIAVMIILVLRRRRKQSRASDLSKGNGKSKSKELMD